MTLFKRQLTLMIEVDVQFVPSNHREDEAAINIDRSIHYKVCLQSIKEEGC